MQRLIRYDFTHTQLIDDQALSLAAPSTNRYQQAELFPKRYRASLSRTEVAFDSFSSVFNIASAED